jgi:hypothetical protein
MEPILTYLQRKLREAGSARWEAIAKETGIEKNLPRKLAYGNRPNPGLKHVQPLLDLFQAVERGERELPEAANDEQKARA